jgi:hypothetical protein
MRARSVRRAVPILAAGSLILGAGPTASADDPFLTGTAPMITLTDPTTSDALPIITVGDEVGDFFFEGIPDGIGAMPGTGGKAEVFVNHEQSRVPFGTSADLKMASVSHLTLASGGGVIEGSVAIPDSVSFQRFCSSTMAGPAEGLEGYLYLTGEEAPEPLPVPAGAPYGPDPAYAPANTRQSGLVAVLDPVSGDFTAVPGMGRHNHENVMALPGDWDQIALYSGDDTFTPPAPASQMYLYLANDEQEIWDDEGTLWAFRVTAMNGDKVDPADAFNDANDYSDLVPGDHVAGRFIRVPENVAKGLTSQQPQQALETWSNAHNVFQFIRVEDSAYDPRVGPGENPVMFFTDTGSGSVVEDPATGRLTTPPAGMSGPFNRGRIFRMEFGHDNPRKVVDLSILLDGNLSPNPFAGNAMRSPDNLGTSDHSLMVQEDTSSQVSRILRYDFDAVAPANPWSVVASVNDQDWESSGIVDASDFFGDGTWLLNVQAHDLRVGMPETIDGITYKREGGQLILLTVDGR